MVGGPPAAPDVVGGSAEWPKVVGGPSGRGQNWSVGPPAGTEVVGSPAKWSNVVGGPLAKPELVGYSSTVPEVVEGPFGRAGSGKRFPCQG